MTLRIAFVAGAIALANAPASAQTPTWAPTPQSASRMVHQPMIQAGLFTVNPDGRGSGSAVQTGEHVGADLAGVVYIRPCGGIGASSLGRPVSAFATDVWMMSGKVLELTEQQASVHIGWRRVRRGGVEENSPEQSITLTLKRGERSTLETMAVPAAGSCEARNMSLDVVFASRQELYGISAAEYAGGSRGSAGAGSGTGAGSSSAAGGGSGYVRGGTSSLAVRKTGEPAREKLSADLWLVRSTPGRADETLHITSQIIPIPVSYAFAPLTIDTAAGSVTVKVEGTVEVGESSEGERRVHFTATRSVTSSTSNRPARDARPVVEGSTKTTVALPGPDEVLSFEMPPLRTADGVTLPDRLSIRVRVAPSPIR
jgi:hypothetical protein